MEVRHTPRVGKVNSKQPDESNGNPALRHGKTLIQVPLGLVDTLDSGHDNVTNEHANGTDNQEALTAELVQEADSRESEDDLQDTSDTSSQESGLCGGETETAEDLRSVVQDGVDTSELLANHSSATEHQTLEHVGGEQSLPWGESTAGANELTLSLLVEHDGGLDLKEFSLQQRVVGCETAELGE